MSKRATHRLAAATAAAVLALPALALVESYDYRAEEELRAELVLPAFSVRAPVPPAAFVNPHDVAPPPADARQDDLEPRLDMRSRPDDPLEELKFERDGRSNSDGSPRLKDLVNPDRRR